MRVILALAAWVFFLISVALVILSFVVQAGTGMLVGVPAFTWLELGIFTILLGIFLLVLRLPRSGR